MPNRAQKPELVETVEELTTHLLVVFSDPEQCPNEPKELARLLEEHAKLAWRLSDASVLL